MNVIVLLCLVAFCNVTVAQVSKMTCACLCFGKCRRYMWDSSNSDCILHETGYVNTTTNAVKKLSGNQHKDCHVAGYDYDWETDTCLKLFQTGGITWTEARGQCLLDGGDLITITTKEKWDLIQNYVNCSNTGMWIGSKTEKWTTEEPFVNKFNATATFNYIDLIYKRLWSHV